MGLHKDRCERKRSCMIGRWMLLLAMTAGLPASGMAQAQSTLQGTPGANSTTQQDQQQPGGQTSGQANGQSGSTPNPDQKNGQKPPEKAPAKPPQPPPIVVMQPPPPPPPRKIEVGFDLAVTDGEGKPQTGVTARDLSIHVDDQALTPESFHAFDGVNDKGEPPVEVIFVLDLVNTKPEQWAGLSAQVAKFLRENDGQLAHPTALVNFLPDDLQIQEKPLSNGNGLARAIERMPPPTGAGEFDPFDASLRALQAIVNAEAAAPGRKLMFWIGPGWMTPSSMAQTASARDSDLNWMTLVGVTNQLRDGRIVLFGGHAGESARGGGADGMRSAAQLNMANLGLEAIAVRSGGSALVSTDQDDALLGQIEKDVEEAAPYYRLTIGPSHADGQDAYHEVKIGVNRAGLTAHGITGYFNEVTGQADPK